MSEKPWSIESYHTDLGWRMRLKHLDGREIDVDKDFSVVEDIAVSLNRLAKIDAHNGEDPLELTSLIPFSEDGVRMIPFCDGPIWAVLHNEVCSISWQHCRVVHVSEGRYRIVHQQRHKDEIIPVYSTAEAAQRGES